MYCCYEGFFINKTIIGNSSVMFDLDRLFIEKCVHNHLKSPEAHADSMQNLIEAMLIFDMCEHEYNAWHERFVPGVNCLVRTGLGAIHVIITVRNMIALLCSAYEILCNTDCATV